MNVASLGCGLQLNTVDYSRGWETASDPSGWTKTDTGSKITIQSSAQHHSGSYSMAISAANSTTANEKYDTGAPRSSASLSIWYRTPATGPSVDDGFGFISVCGSTSATYNIVCIFGRVSGVYYFKLRGNSAAVLGPSASLGTWYRIEIQYAQNATCTLRIFDVDGNQVGTDITATANNNSTQYIFVGTSVSISSAQSWGASYIDDFGILWTGSTYPLWPFAINN